MVETCKYCLGKFRDKSSLINHQNKTQYCQKYKDVNFTCERCGFNTKGIKNIDNHLLQCPTNETRPLPSVSIQEYQKELTIEKIKSTIWRKLLEDNTDIRTNDIFCNYENILEINTAIPIDQINIIISEQSQNIDVKQCHQNTKEDVKEDPTYTPKKQTYRPLKTNVEIINTDTVVESDTIPNEKSSMNLDTINTEILGLFDKLKQSRTYKQIIEQIRRLRNNMIEHIHIDEYIEIVKDHIEKIQEFLTSKNYQLKKLQGIISEHGLSSLEIRLTRYGKYTNSHLDIDEMQILLTSICNNTETFRYFKPFNADNICRQFYMYGVALFSLDQLLDIFLFNKYKYFNLIYLPLAKSMDSDPYSFYTLERVKNNKKFWNMDCRLDDTSNNIISNILPYMVNLFRSIYKHIFGDNNFRKDYSTTCQITECDCEQLLQNIIKLSNSKQFCLQLQRKVISKATYEPKEDLDRFNLKGDDALQRKQFHEKSGDSIEVLKTLFDDISTEDTVDFYRSRIT
jgi:hypothetical protein